MTNRLGPLWIFGGLALFATPLAGCDTSLRPPTDVGVCYQYVSTAGGKSHFNVLQQNTKTLEACAGALEAMRLKFLGLGGNQTSITGAYQSKFIFVEQDGIFTADTLKGSAYLALVRTDDGRLAQPGAVRR